MCKYSIDDIIRSSDRYKLFTLMCLQSELAQGISYLKSQLINVINIGKGLAEFVDGIEDYSYLNIEVYEHLIALLNRHKTKINSTGNEILAIYNIGILLEPRLELNATQLLKDFSKTTALIIIWEFQSPIPDRLHWSTQQNNVFLDFTDTQLKKLQYAL